MALPEPSQAETLAALLMSAPPERQEQLRDAIWDRACGYRWWSGEGKKPGGKEVGARQRRVRVEDLDTGEAIEGWVYEIPGDPASQKLLVEHGTGRPPVREHAKVDPVIEFICRVPGKPEHKGPAPDVAGEEARAGSEAPPPSDATRALAEIGMDSLGEPAEGA